MTDLIHRTGATGPIRSESQTNRTPGPDAPAATEEGLSFWDVLDIVNPLHHLPIVGAIYRHVTGDEIATPARVAGGALFGGVPGFLVSLAESVVEHATGRDFGEHAVAVATDMFGGEAAPEDGATMLAQSPESVTPAAGLPAAFADFALPGHPPEESSAIPPLAGAASGVPQLEGAAALDQFLLDAGMAPALPVEPTAKPSFGGLTAAVPPTRGTAALAALDPSWAKGKLPGQAGPPAFPDAMMQGLDKYARLKQAQTTTGRDL